MQQLSAVNGIIKDSLCIFYRNIIPRKHNKVKIKKTRMVLRKKIKYTGTFRIIQIKSNDTEILW